jgi:hypothetical protein
MNYTITANSGFYFISGKDISFFTSFLSAEAGSFIITDSYAVLKKGTITDVSTYTPFTGCIVCSAFNANDPYEENDVVPFVDCEDYAITDPFTECTENGIYPRVSSTPYPILTGENLASEGIIFLSAFLNTRKTYSLLEELESSGISFISGDLRTVLYRYSLTESIDSSGIIFSSGTLRNVLKRYTLDEYVDSSGISFISGTLRDALIRYENWPMEGIDSSGISFISGTLT